MTELEEFADLVARMRAAQATYFTNRSNIVLKQAKALERQVDDRLREIQPKNSVKDRAQNLFS